MTSIRRRSRVTPRLAGALALMVLYLVAPPVSAQTAVTPDLPLLVPDSEWHPLREQLDPKLQGALETRLNRNAVWRKLLEEQRMAVSIVDLSDPSEPRFARVNGDVMMYAASLPKIAILLAAMQQIEDGKLKETPAVTKDLNDMIRISSNSAATRMIDAVGGLAEIEKVLRDPRYQLFDADRGGGLWVGKRYSKSNRRNPDPLKGLSHGATATQVSRFYYLIAQGRLVSRDRSKQMLEILADPGINHKFVNTLTKLAPRARLYRKSGSWRDWHSDSVLVWGPEWRRYVVVCLVEDENGERIIRNIIPAIESVLKPEKSRGAVSASAR